MLLALALLLAHTPPPGKPDAKVPVEPTATTDEIWTSRCKACHKADGRGSKEKQVPDFTSAKWQAGHSDADLRTVIENGAAQTKMNGFKDKMTDPQLDAIIAFIRTLKK